MMACPLPPQNPGSTTVTSFSLDTQMFTSLNENIVVKVENETNFKFTNKFNLSLPVIFG